MSTTPKSLPPASISPRLQGYLTTAEEVLQDRTKAPSQHAAARRIRDAILGQSKRVPASNLLSPKPKQQEPVAALELPLDPHPPESRTAMPETSEPPTPPAPRSPKKPPAFWRNMAGSRRSTSHYGSAMQKPG